MAAVSVTPVHGEALPALVHCPHPLMPARDRRILRDPARPGETLLAYLGRHDIRPTPGADLITVNGHEVDAARWAEIRPLGARVIVTACVAGGGSGRKIVRTVLQIAVLAAAIYVPGALELSGITAALVGTGIAVAGNLVVDALAPLPVPAAPDLGSVEQAPPSLAAGQSQVRRYQPLPLVLGQHRMFPDHAAIPRLSAAFESNSVSDYYYRVDASGEHILDQRFSLGLGAPVMSDARIGNTPINDLGSAAVTLTPGSGDQEPPATGGLFYAPLEKGGQFGDEETAIFKRVTPDNTTGFNLLLEGHYYTPDDPKREVSLVGLLRYRRISPGVTSWTTPGTTFGNLNNWYSNGDSEHRRIAISHSGLTPGQYEIEFTVRSKPPAEWERWARSSGGGLAGSIVRQLFGQLTEGFISRLQITAWTCTLRRPYDHYGQTLVSAAIRPRGGLSGAVSRLSGLVTQQWAPSLRGQPLSPTSAGTSNPATSFLQLARGERDRQGRLLYGAGLRDADIDLVSVEAWRAFCTRRALKCNAILQDARSCAEALSLVARCGRAAITYATGKLGVVWDEARAATAMFGPANIVAGTFQVEYLGGADLADEIEVEYINEDDEWRTNTVRATVPGAARPARTSRVRLWGVTAKSQASLEANRQAAKQHYHRRRYTWETDWEGLAVAKGDVVWLSHDLTQPDVAGRLAGGTVSALELPSTPPASASHVQVQAPDGTLTMHTIDGIDDRTISVSPPLAQLDSPEDVRYAIYSPSAGIDANAPHEAARKVKIVSIQPLPGGERVRLTARDEASEYYDYAEGRLRSYSWGSLTTWDNWSHWGLREAPVLTTL